MSNDLRIIKQLEKKLKIKFVAKFTADEETNWGKSFAQYELNTSEQVIKLRLYKHKSQKLLLEMANLVNLQQLDLSDNQISTWPVEMAQLGIETYWENDYTKESGILLQDNPLENPPPEIIKQGNAAIIEYFQAGKTSLIKHLLGQDFNPNESQTKGININDWEVVDITHCEIATENDKIKTHLWDFGGQEVMHATHQFFLSKHSLYILILDGRKDEKTEYWPK